MIMVGSKDGIITVEMNAQDAQALASMISSSEEVAVAMMEDWQKQIQKNLPNVLLELAQEEGTEGKLEEPEYYLHVERGDLYHINWKQNRPAEIGWVKISKTVYEAVFYGMRGQKLS